MLLPAFDYLFRFGIPAVVVVVLVVVQLQKRVAIPTLVVRSIVVAVCLSVVMTGLWRMFQVFVPLW